MDVVDSKSQPKQSQNEVNKNPSKIDRSQEKVIADITQKPLNSITKNKQKKWLLLILLVFLIIILLFLGKYYYLSKISNNTPYVETILNDDGIQLDSSNKDDEYTTYLSYFPSSAPLPSDLKGVRSAHFKIIKNSNNELVRIINKPITITIKYSAEELRECLQDENQLRAYAHDPKNDELILLESNIDKEKQEVASLLYSLYPNGWNGHTEVILTIPRSKKYIFGCGVDAKMYLEGDRFILSHIGLSLTLPDPSQRPMAMGGGPYIMGATIPLPHDLSKYGHIEISTFYDYDKIQIEQLNNLELPPDGSGDPFKYIPSQSVILKKEVIEHEQNKFLLLKTNLDKKLSYYVFVINPLNQNKEYNIVHIFKTEIDTNPSAADQLKIENIIKQILNSVEFFEKKQ